MMRRTYQDDSCQFLNILISSAITTSLGRLFHTGTTLLVNLQKCFSLVFYYHHAIHVYSAKRVIAIVFIISRPPVTLMYLVPWAHVLD